jgi:hypothetical protein
LSCAFQQATVGEHPSVKPTQVLVGRRLQGAYKLGQTVVLRVTVAQMLTETLGISHADTFALLPTPTPHGFQIFVHTVVFQEPLPLAGVAGQHLCLAVYDAAYIHVKLSGHWSAE